MSLDCNRFASPPLLWLNLVGASSIVIWTILGINTQAVQAQAEPQKQSELLNAIQPPTSTLDHQDTFTQSPSSVKEAILQPNAPTTSVTILAPSKVAFPVAKDQVLGTLEPQFTNQNRCDDQSCGLVNKMTGGNQPQETESPSGHPLVDSVNSPRANVTVAQLPYPPLTPAPIPVPASPIPSSGGPNSRLGQLPYPAQPVPIRPPAGLNNYSQTAYPQGGQQAYYPQMMMLVPVPTNGMPQPMGYPQMGQPPLVPNQPGFNGYPQMGQPMGYPQMVQPLPPPLVPNQPGFNGYPQMGQNPYYPPMNPGNNYPQMGQNPYYPPMNPGNNYPQPVGQNPYYPPMNPGNNYPATNLAQPALVPQNQQQSLLRSTALTAPSLQLQGTYINQGDLSSARARLAALYPLTPQVQFGATLDLTSEANSFADSRGQGLNVNELYVATAPFTGLPNLRFVAGQLDLTSYFDRNSFAKDGATQFFNPVFQTNPALSATGIASRPGALVNWTLTDNIEAKAAVFSSSRSLSDFSLDGFAGEVGFRYGNAIVRGSFVSDRDAGSRDGFREIFGVRRADGGTGPRSADRENAYGVNAEYFVPNLNMGLFARYGRYDNQALKLGGDTYSVGVSFFDVISKDDRLGLAYGRNLSNNLLRQVAKADVPDVLELFYDFRFLPNLRLGFTLQQRNGFEDTYAGFRIKTDFDLTPRGRLTQ